MSRASSARGAVDAVLDRLAGKGVRDTVKAQYAHGGGKPQAFHQAARDVFAGDGALLARHHDAELAVVELVERIRGKKVREKERPRLRPLKTSGRKKSSSTLVTVSPGVFA